MRLPLKELPRRDWQYLRLGAAVVLPVDQKLMQDAALQGLVAEGRMFERELCDGCVV